MSLAVIVPVLNEEDAIAACISPRSAAFGRRARA
jgi:hypothetical protein